MQIITSMAGVVSSIRPSEGIRDLHRAGMNTLLVEFDAFCPEQLIWPEESIAKEERALRLDRFRQGFAWMKEACCRYGVSPRCGALPKWRWKPASVDFEQKFQKYREISVECVRACEDLGCGFVIVPPLSEGFQREELWEVNRSYYLHLANACTKGNTRLLLQNAYRDLHGHPVRGVCSDAGEVLDWIEALNREAGEERFGFCLDYGVCNLCGQDIREFTVQLAPVLKAVVASDNDGRVEQTLLPFTGVAAGVDWLSAFRGLREIDFDELLIFCYGSTAASCSPILMPQLLSMVKSTADYFVWQIQMELAMKKYRSIVLFGAGNMCRNYMKNYGEKYPPLFTCDNNPARWGERFCGLEIKPPEALKSLPEDCGVFICNIYYREIEEQLRAMGLVNIEFFNDEYMPAFDFERLEMR